MEDEGVYLYNQKPSTTQQNLYTLRLTTRNNDRVVSKDFGFKKAYLDQKKAKSLEKNEQEASVQDDFLGNL